LEIAELLKSESAPMSEFTIISPNSSPVTDLAAAARPTRKQVAVVFADIVESTELVARLGDVRCVELLSSYYAMVRRELSKFRGFHLSTAGDGFVAAGNHCANAIRGSAAIRTKAGELKLKVRIGVHAGECIAFDGFLTGLTVHIGARIAAIAAADEMLVSHSVKAQLKDHEIKFVDRSIHHLKGVPGTWQLFATLQT
jgi:class 3 adenylate cyclase